MRTLIYFLLLTLALPRLATAQAPATIPLPTFGDPYSRYVQELEAGRTGIDYQAFRFSFLESEQFKVAARRRTTLDSLELAMRASIIKRDYPDLIRITRQMLAIDYTSLLAHKILRQTYMYVGDTANAAKYKAIQFGLLRSITGRGDGKTCATAWPVIQLSEEYFLLEMLGARLKKQGTDNAAGLCDKMEVLVDGDRKTYYFDIRQVVVGYHKLGIK
jgi:hypothetical protein